MDRYFYSCMNEKRNRFYPIWINVPKYKLNPNNIEKVIFNPPATVVIFKDGTKSIVKTNNKEEKYDPEIGFAMAMMNEMFGSRSAFKKFINKYDINKAENKVKDKKPVDEVEDKVSEVVPDIHEKVIEIIADQSGFTVQEVMKSQGNLKYDLGLDSLDTVEIILALECEFKIMITNEELYKYKLKTVEDICNIIYKKING